MHRCVHIEQPSRHVQDGLVVQSSPPQNEALLVERLQMATSG
ncbi:unnamed protein product [Onchocerca flexuosa]|uniref:Transposase n=1 Tax=Onchocerca flexuosa TaxID=387005 RepID=A0A183HXU5_9BILA|nr:unnamed protein product [Onchocerca flexuosa]